MNRQEPDKVVKRMAEPPKAAVPKKPAAAPETGESLDKIRDILFGNQAREYDRRFATVEDQLRQDAANLRQEVTRRLDSLESYFKKEVTALLDRLKKEQADREVSAKSIEDTITRDTRALREELHEQSKSLEGEMRRRHDEVASALSRSVADLRHAKTDRADLSALFAELAVRIGEDLEKGQGGVAGA